MRIVGPIDDISSKDDEVPYPHLEIDGIILVQQVSRFVILEEDNQADLLIIPAYGITKEGSLRFIGNMALTHTLILHLEYMGLTTKYIESEQIQSELTDEKHLVTLITNKYLRSLICYMQ